MTTEPQDSDSPQKVDCSSATCSPILLDPEKLERLIAAAATLEFFASKQKTATIGGVDWRGMATEIRDARIDFEGRDRCADDESLENSEL